MVGRGIGPGQRGFVLLRGAGVSTGDGLVHGPVHGRSDAVQLRRTWLTGGRARHDRLRAEPVPAVETADRAP